MEAVIDDSTRVFSGEPFVRTISRDETPVKQGTVAPETAVEIGIWLSSMESFLTFGRYKFHIYNASKVTADHSRDLEIAHSALVRCGKIWTRMVQSQPDGFDTLTRAELDELGAGLRNLVHVGGCVLRAEPLVTGELNACCDLLSEKLDSLPAVHKLIRCAETNGESFLPEPLKGFASRIEPMSAEDAELALILPRFGTTLKWLSVIGKMLEADEPLKPALLIFSSVNEQASYLIDHINNRLQRFATEKAEIFASLDAASYTVSLELRKVYSQELAGLTDLRPPPSIYACVETAYSLLNESLQQTLAGLAGLIDPSVNVATLFPSFQRNFDRSLRLRRDLWGVVRLTQAAEKAPEKPNIDALNRSLRSFVNGTVRYLFYKDSETVERFVEEILVTKQTKDLVPILHRFGAYLEALFRQVNMRSVLESHPFETN